MASPASSSIPPHSTTNVGPLNTAGTGGCAPLGAVPPGGAPGGAPGGNPMYMLQWHEHHASFFRSVIVFTYKSFAFIGPKCLAFGKALKTIIQVFKDFE